MNTRDLFFNTVYQKVQDGEDIVILTCDRAAPSLDKFREDFPDRYFSVGIAEQNLIDIASGLAKGGKKVIAYGLNPFIVTRAIDQIMNTMSLMNIPVLLAGFETGFSSALSGATHFVLTDMSVIRTCPNITVYNASDVSLSERIFEQILKFGGPCYIRFDKAVSYEIERKEVDFDAGYSQVEYGQEYCIVSTGHYVKLIQDILPELRVRGINPTLLDVFRYPCDDKKLADCIRAYRKIVSVEEHILTGGLGSYLLEIMADNDVLRPMKRVGVNGHESYPNLEGDRSYYDRLVGLDAESLLKVFLREFA